jgi:hypothetical protein
MTEPDDPTNMLGLDPDHPLLQKAQQALKEQLLENKQRVEGELREKNNLLKVMPMCIFYHTSISLLLARTTGCACRSSARR